MHLRYCLPEVKKRGYGLGNEFIPWSRAFLAAQLLDATLLPPAFGLNRRRYWRHFGTPLDDWIQHRALVRLLPCIEFTERDYLDHGGEDLLAALRSFAAVHRLAERGSWVLKTSGLWGGYGHIAPAREFIRATLYGSRYAPRNLLRLRERLDARKLLVAMHVRLGDFRPADAQVDYRQAANVSLPIGWFCDIARQLEQRLPGGVQFLVVSDGEPEALRPLTETYPCVTTRDLANSDCSDLLALADADLLVCSASTFSAIAALISDSPYLWFAGNLHRHPEGCYSLGQFATAAPWQRLPVEQAVREYAHSAGQWPARGFGIAEGGPLPAALLPLALARQARRQARYDLVNYGVSPVSTGG
jgi:hypothetical protein